MTKLHGTSGQLFAAIAESLNTRGMARSTKGSAGPAHEDSSFKDLLHTVSSLAKVALNDRKSEVSTKAGNLRTRLAQPAESDEPKAETGDEPVGTVDQPDSSPKSGPLDRAPTVHTQNQPALPAVVGQELAALPVLKPQAQTPGASRTTDKTLGPDRSEQPSGARGPRVESAAPAIKANAAESETLPPVGARQAAAPPQGEAAPQVSAAPSKNMPASAGFEAVAANIEHAVRAAGRETLPEVTKVTVVQQQTHFPPVAQFTPTQQVASAVVAELDNSGAAAASASSAAPDLAAPQSGASDQPLRILTISLEPAELGNVTVRLRLVGAAISVHLAADRRETSQMLDQQRDTIQELMQSAGYVADVAPVQHGSLDGFQAGSGQPQSSLPGQQQQQQQPQPQGTFDGSSTSSGQADGGAKQARQERRPNQETRHDPDVAPLDRRGPVYL